MVRDLLGNRIKNYNHIRKQELMEKYYVFNNKVYQIIRASNGYKLDGGMFYSFTVQDIKSKKIIVKEHIWAKQFEDMVFYHKKSQALNKIEGVKKFQYNYCYFTNDNIDLVNALYDLGYENFGRQTGMSYHQYPFTVIKKGLLMTYSESEIEVEGNAYRKLSLVDGKLNIEPKRRFN